MTIKTLLASVAIVAGLCVGQAHAASVTVIHGINGLDLNAERTLPVDIAVNGTCALKGVKFTQSKKVALENGSYRITVHPADGSCSSEAVIDQSVTVKDQTSLSIVASLNSTGAPSLAVYDNFVMAVAVGVRNVAYAPPVFVKIDAASYSSQPVKRIRSGKGGALFAVWDTSIDYRITIASRRGGGILDILNGKIRSSRVVWRYFYVVGSVKNGLAIVRQDVKQSELS